MSVRLSIPLQFERACQFETSPIFLCAAAISSTEQKAARCYPDNAAFMFSIGIRRERESGGRGKLCCSRSPSLFGTKQITSFFRIVTRPLQMGCRKLRRIGEQVKWAETCMSLPQFMHTELRGYYDNQYCEFVTKYFF